jgi:hypothetical protein
VSSFLPEKPALHTGLLFQKQEIFLLASGPPLRLRLLGLALPTHRLFPEPSNCQKLPICPHNSWGSVPHRFQELSDAQSGEIGDQTHGRNLRAY